MAEDSAEALDAYVDAGRARGREGYRVVGHLS
jgi:hypothetical protein